ncbi:MAG: hypothetical protein ACJ74B_13585, partial [Gaiellaceae bacterium]
RAATLLARPDGGHGDVVIVRTELEPRPDPAVLRHIERRVFRQGFDGRVRTAVDDLAHGVAKAVLTSEPSVVIVDDPSFDACPGGVPVLVVQGSGPAATRMIGDGGEGDSVAAEVTRRLARGEAKAFRLPGRSDRSSRGGETPPPGEAVDGDAGDTA